MSVNGFVEYQRGLGGVRTNHEKLQVGVATVFELSPACDIEASNLVFLCSCDTEEKPIYSESEYALDTAASSSADAYHADLSYSLKEILEVELAIGALQAAVDDFRPIRVTLQGFYGRSSLTHSSQHSGPSFSKTILAYASGIHSKFTCIGRQSTISVCVPDQTEPTPILFNQLYNMLTVESNVGLLLVRLTDPISADKWICIVCTFNGLFYTVGHDSMPKSLEHVFPAIHEDHPLQQIIATANYHIDCVIGPIPIGKLASKSIKIMGDGHDRLSLSIHHNIPEKIWKQTPVWRQV